MLEVFLDFWKCNVFLRLSMFFFIIIGSAAVRHSQTGTTFVKGSFSVNISVDDLVE